MANSFAQLPAACHRLLPEISGPMAKADLRKTEMVDWRRLVGGAIERMQSLCGLSLKELSEVVGRDERQIARWIAGTERPQLDALFAAETLRQPLVVALAELAQNDGIEIVTEIRVRRRA
jgi:hypothetical protein